MNDLLAIFNEIDVWAIIAILALSVVAGFIDSVVGGGGLVQIPALLINLPSQPLMSLLGTNKMAAIAGMTMAASQYAKKVKFDFRLLAVIALAAFGASNLGVKLLHYIDVEILKPIILVVLVLIFIYSLIKKDLGAVQTKKLSLRKRLLFGALIGTLVGFYDGFIGPGTGSFLVLGFVVILGFEFITASAYAKIINCFSAISAMIVFVQMGNYILGLGILMSICNISGNFIGSRMALKNGNGFIRYVFIIIVGLMILRYAYDIFFK